MYFSMTGFAVEGRTVDAFFLSFNKASDYVLHNSLESKEVCYGLHECTTREVKHCPDDWTQSVVVNASIKGITAGICTQMCLDYDYVT